ncbi:hypothetical protein EON66_04000 [archaeon]|nr:MAG: hypothetical protein EON66_04000 [archaeon]
MRAQGAQVLGAGGSHGVKATGVDAGGTNLFYPLCGDFHLGPQVLDLLKEGRILRHGSARANTRAGACVP